MATYEFTEIYIEEYLYISEYNKVHNELEKIYGEPDTSLQVWKESYWLVKVKIVLQLKMITLMFIS